MMSMNSPVTLTKDDFINSGWQDVVNTSERKDCFIYYNAFCKKAREAQKAGKNREKAVFEILITVTIFPIKLDSSEGSPEGLQEFFTDEQRDFLEKQLGFLTEIAPEISDAELQARIADILWLRRGDYKMAQLAIPAYLRSATILESPKNWTYCVDRIKRALCLERQISSRHEDISSRHKDVFAHIEAVLDRYQDQNLLCLSPLMELLQEHGLGEPAKYAALAEKAATLAETLAQSEALAFLWARKFWNIKAKWHRMEKDNSKKFAALMSAAETYEKEAEFALNMTPPNYMLASSVLQRGIEAFRKIPGTKEQTVEAKAKAEALHKFFIQCQEKIPKEMIPIPFPPIYIDDLVEESRNHVRGKTIQEALFAFALLFNPTDVSQLRQEVEQLANEFPDFFPVVKINEKGKVVARRPDNNDEEAIRFEMYRNAILDQKLNAQAYIEPARHQINLEHNVRIDDMLSILSHSPFIPPKRECLFAKGLYAGLKGDFFTSTHILIPQIENSIRYLLSQRGIVTSSLDDNGIQNEYDLKRLLNLPETASIFDENTLFDLKGMLVERAGSNLRNRMAHGLMSDEEFMSPFMSYIWWLTLRLCCLPLIYQQEVEQSKTSTD